MWGKRPPTLGVWDPQPWKEKSKTQKMFVWRNNPGVAMGLIREWFLWFHINVQLCCLLGDVGPGSRRTMGSQWVLRRKETLGCVRTTVSTSGKDGGRWLWVCVGVKKENLHVVLFKWWWSLSVHFEGKFKNPPGVWAGEKLIHSVSES